MGLADRGKEGGAQLVALDVDAQRFDRRERRLDLTAGLKQVAAVAFEPRDVRQHASFVVRIADGARYGQSLVEAVERLLLLAHLAVERADVLERARQLTPVADRAMQGERLIEYVERLLLISQVRVTTGDVVER